MIELCRRRVPGFSTGSLLAPRGWTCDVASHYVVHSAKATLTSTRGDKCVPETSTPPASLACESDAANDQLPVGTSSNTARFECMSSGREGNTLCVTELFVPRGPSSGAASWDAAHIEDVLFQRVGKNDRSALENGDVAVRQRSNSAGTKTWVVEVLHGSKVDGENQGVTAAPDAALTLSSSLFDAVSPFFRLFVEVVWTHERGDAELSPEDVAQRIMADLKRQYHTPALRLDTFCCFTHQTRGAAAAAAAGVVPIGGAAAPTATSADAVRAGGSSSAPQLREPCTPFVLADMQSSRVSSLWSTSLYSAAAGAFVQFLLPLNELPANVECWNLNCRSPIAEAPPDQEGASSTRATSAAALHHLLQRQLHLQWEGLTVATALPCPCVDVTGASTSCTSAVDIAVAALPLDALATPSSLYSFVSVEHAWETHVAHSMEEEAQMQRRRQCAPQRSGLLKDWKLEKLTTTPAPRLDELNTAIDAAEMQRLQIDNPLITAAERAMLSAAADGAASSLAPRRSTYLLRLIVSENAGPSACPDSSPLRTQGEEERERNTDELYLLQLHAPRVQSRHALVVCMRVPAVWLPINTAATATQGAGGKKDGINSDLARRWCNDGMPRCADAALSRAYRLAPYTPSLWLPRDAGHSVTSGVCARSGRLVLHVPAGDARYANIRLAPIAANSFTSLGCIAAWVRHDEFCASSAAAQVGAVWTLVGDGRSAATYLEDALMEYMYDTGSKNLNNVAQPSQHARQPGVLVVRKKQWRKVRATTTASHFGMLEMCSAWVDVGSAHRLLLRVRDVGVGEVLVTEASLVGPYTEPAAAGKNEASVTQAESISCDKEEEALEEWIEGIAGFAVLKNLR